jgi:hypothetical protein
MTVKEKLIALAKYVSTECDPAGADVLRTEDLTKLKQMADDCLRSVGEESEAAQAAEKGYRDLHNKG